MNTPLISRSSLGKRRPSLFVGLALISPSLPEPPTHNMIGGAKSTFNPGFSPQNVKCRILSANVASLLTEGSPYVQHGGVRIMILPTGINYMVPGCTRASAGQSANLVPH